MTTKTETTETVTEPQTNEDSGWSEDYGDDETTYTREGTDAPESDEDEADDQDDAGTADDAQDDEDGAEDDEAPKGRNREAGYRKRAKDAETRADALAARIEKMQRSEAERLASSRLIDGGDLWRYGGKLSKILDDSGEIDRTALNAFIEKLAEDRPHLTKRRKLPAPDKSQGGGKNTGASGKASWGDILKGVNR